MSTFGVVDFLVCKWKCVAARPYAPFTPRIKYLVVYTVRINMILGGTKGKDGPEHFGKAVAVMILYNAT